MGIMVYSLLWVMQDFVHQPNQYTTHYEACNLRTLFKRKLTNRLKNKVKNEARKPETQIFTFVNVGSRVYHFPLNAKP